MELKCKAPKCENRALLLYGTNWICGECFTKIQQKEIERKSKLVEEL